jgi:hypothetical protein
MSALFDQMTSDLASIAASGAELGITATLTAAQGGVSGTVSAIFGDSTDALQVAAAGMADDRGAPVTLIRSEVVAILGRDLVEGDTLTVATGADAGTWTVSTAVPDDGGGILAAVKRANIHSARRIQ